jgi:hypothetical protein
LEEEMMLRERAEAAARAIGYYSPEGGRDSKGRPFSVDIEYYPIIRYQNYHQQ